MPDDDRLYGEIIHALKFMPREGRGYIVQALAPIPRLYANNGGFQEATRRTLVKLDVSCSEFLKNPS